MNKLLLLSNRHTTSDSQIWLEGIRRGWKTHRACFSDPLEDVCKGFDKIMYYGDTLHADFIKDRVPIKFGDTDPKLLEIISPLITERMIHLMEYSNLVQPLFDTLFVKPVNQKWFEARVYKSGELIEGAPQKDDLIYIQTPVSFIDEVRCFCLDGKILTASYYRKNKEFCPEKYDFTTNKKMNESVEYIYSYKNLIHRASVIDFGLVEYKYKPNRWAVIEFNQPWASGLYACGKEAFDVIEASVDPK